MQVLNNILDLGFLLALSTSFPRGERLIRRLHSRLVSTPVSLVDSVSSRRPLISSSFLRATALRPGVDTVTEHLLVVDIQVVDWGHGPNWLSVLLLKEVLLVVDPLQLPALVDDLNVLLN